MSAATIAPPEPPTRCGDDLDALVEQIVEGLPPLSDEQRAELGQLLASPH